MAIQLVSFYSHAASHEMKEIAHENHAFERSDGHHRLGAVLHLQADCADGVFPKPVPLGARATGWVSDEVESWILERIGERDQAG